jgi:arsenate reductase (glutaredoxin)
MLTIYHNGDCSKSNGALELLQQKSILFDVRFYLTDPLNADELKALLQKMKMPAKDLVRKSEPVYAANYDGKVLSEEEWIQAMATHPVLIERPIIVSGDKAIIARPPEKVLELL